MRQLGEMVSKNLSLAPLATLLINTGAVCRFRLWLELLGTVRFSCHGRLTAVGKYIQFWYPEIPTWVSPPCSLW